jgi:hypothetical protein
MSDQTTFICDNCGDDRKKNPCIFIGYEGNQPIYCPSERKGHGPKWYATELQYRPPEQKTKPNDIKTQDELDRELTEAKIRSVNAKAEEQELLNSEKKRQRFKNPSRMIDYQILAWECIGDIRNAKIKVFDTEKEADKYQKQHIEPVIPNCFVCNWVGVEYETEHHKPIDKSSYISTCPTNYDCLAMGGKDCHDCHGTDECKALYEVK